MKTYPNSRPNTVSFRIERLRDLGEHEAAHALIRCYGHIVAESPANVQYWRLGDDIVCVKSFTQYHFTGHLSQSPQWRLPADATPTQAYRDAMAN